MTTSVSRPGINEAKLNGQRIVICLDRSTFSEACVPYAVTLSKTFGSAITLVHVMQSHQQRVAPQGSDALGWELSRQEAQSYLEKFQETISQTLHRAVDVRLEQGRPAERLIDVAREISADLTMLGSRGEGGAPAWSLGSTVQQVLTLARTSLFIAPASPDPIAAESPKRILVPLDGSIRTESALPTAARLARSYGAEILLVHVVQEPLATPMLDTAADMELAQELAERTARGAERYLENLKRQIEQDNTSVRTSVVRHANPYQGLLEISQKQNAHLIVLSAHGAACDSGRSFGSVTSYLLTHAKVPLLVLQDVPEHALHSVELSAANPSPPSLRASFAAENA